jgi:hypothetical protein
MRKGENTLFNINIDIRYPKDTSSKIMEYFLAFDLRRQSCMNDLAAICGKEVVMGVVV